MRTRSVHDMARIQSHQFPPRRENVVGSALRLDILDACTHRQEQRVRERLIVEADDLYLYGSNGSQKLLSGG